MALTAFSINGWTLLPFFLYGGWFNQFINMQRGLPFFYIGETAWTDRMARKYLGENAGVIIFISCNVAVLTEILL